MIKSNAALRISSAAIFIIDGLSSGMGGFFGV